MVLRKSRALVCVVVLSSVSAALAVAPVPRLGTWQAWLDSPGGPLPFELLIGRSGATWKVFIINDVEKIPVPRTVWDGNQLTFNIEHYDSKITATPMPSANGSRIDGEWVKRAAGGGWTRMAFHATHGKERRFARQGPAPAGSTEQGVSGRWSVKFADSDDLAIGVFEKRGDGVDGTFLTTTGDYRYLSGNQDGDRLRLSVFDGAHAFLFDARLQPDGTLKGDFWSRDAYHDTWTAKRNPEADLPDMFATTKWTGNARLGDLSFPDLEGKSRSLTEPALCGKARIIVVFGSWCPNCNDASNYLVELDARYRSRGLKILGLAFELTGDLKRDTKQVKRYVASHGIEYPVLVAGISDKVKATAAFPVLDRVRSYPTTIFLDRRNEVRAIHTGFTGPATGDAYTKLRADFEKLIEELLGE